jgi:hypothetical protein
MVEHRGNADPADARNGNAPCISRFFGYCEKKLDFLMRSAYTVCTDSKIELEIAKQ